ncbi:calnexin [Callorhinchus milii]|uniref:calnexin n=1 Tax=Callorhinchus milii TaxID=7868 RepID=UPI001C3FB5B8|nr:calnexin [Callorhinchus milii]
MQLLTMLCLVACQLAPVFTQEALTDSESEGDIETVYQPPRAAGPVHFTASFDVDGLESWVKSNVKKEDTEEDVNKYDGTWDVEEPRDRAVPGNKGLVLKSRAQHYAISAPLFRPFLFEALPLILQYEVHFQDGSECGGAYLKLLSEDNQLDLRQFFDKTPFTIMFGPDMCGKDYTLHFIIRHKNPVTGGYEEKRARQPDIDLQDYFTDKRPHLYTLIVRPDNTYEMLIDETSVSRGNLLQDMTPPINPPREIEDPDHHQPKDWDDRRLIPDPQAVKPPDWDEEAPQNIPDPLAVKPDAWLDKEPQYIPDPNSERPSDWDDEMDGEWEAARILNPVCESAPGCGPWRHPTIPNPDYKGKWKAPMIDNLKYKGIWKPRKIPNPEYFEDPTPFRMTGIRAVGLELWSVTPNVLFDSFIISSDEAVVKQWIQDTWALKQKAYHAARPGVIMQLFLATHKRPWLWGIYVFTVALPVVLFISFRWPDLRFGPPDDYYYKKTDEVQPDDADQQQSNRRDCGDPGESSHLQQQDAGSKGTKRRGARPTVRADKETAEQAGGSSETGEAETAAEPTRHRARRPE